MDSVSYPNTGSHKSQIKSSVQNQKGVNSMLNIRSVNALLALSDQFLYPYPYTQKLILRQAFLKVISHLLTLRSHSERILYRNIISSILRQCEHNSGLWAEFHWSIWLHSHFNLNQDLRAMCTLYLYISTPIYTNQTEHIGQFEHNQWLWAEFNYDTLLRSHSILSHNFTFHVWPYLLNPANKSQSDATSTIIATV